MNRAWLVSWWPRLVAAGVVLVVLAPAAVASYKHHWTVVARHNPDMADWLPITTDGMLLAALVVLLVVRWGRSATRWIWLSVGLAFGLGLPVTLGGNLAAMLPTTAVSLLVETIVVAVWPPITVAITLELAALLVMTARPAPAPAPVLGPKRPGWWQRKRLVRQWRKQLASPSRTLALGTPAATSSEVPVAADAETEPGGGAAPEADTTHQARPTPPDSETELYRRVVELMGQDHGRPTIHRKLKPEFPQLTEGQVRALMDRRRDVVRASTNGNGSGAS
jgi:hypothetical protein